MKTVTYTEARANFAAVIDSVLEDREEMVITRAGKRSIVMIPLADYEALQETAHLLQSPANARRLLSSIERLEARG